MIMPIISVQELIASIPEQINFAALCKDLRNKLGYKQREMAEVLGVTLRRYQSWEAGDFEPTGKAAYRLIAIRDQLAKTVEPVRDAVKGDLQ